MEVAPQSLSLSWLWRKDQDSTFKIKTTSVLLEGIACYMYVDTQDIELRVFMIHVCAVHDEFAQVNHNA